jgi:thiol-disulfide isomerase/thioredoxin
LNTSRSRLLIGVIAVGGLLLGLGTALHRYASYASDASTAALFEQTFNDADGRPQPMKQWQDRLLVLNFWATWCAPCVEEMPELQKVEHDYAARGVAVVGLGIDNAAAIRRFRDEQRITLPLLVAGAGGSEIARQFGNPSGALPYTVLIDRNGRIVQARLGRIREQELRSWLDARVSKVPG